MSTCSTFVYLDKYSLAQFKKNETSSFLLILSLNAHIEFKLFTIHILCNKFDKRIHC